MNALAGVFSRTGRPIESGWLQRLSARLETFGPDGEHFLLTDRVALVQRPFETERAPAVPPAAFQDERGYILSLSGRIDNAPEILESASRRHLPAALLDLYRREGVRALGRVTGEFLAVIWDPADERLRLFSDPLGRHSLYYALSGDYLYWSSRPGALLELPGVSGALDRNYAADFLINNASSGTPYKDVHKAPGGQATVVSRTAVAFERYWSVDPERRILYKTDREYEEHFLALFMDAVGAGIQTAGPVFCELSGGLDSTTIACVAESLAGADHLRTLAYTFPGSSHSDESEYIAAVTERLDARHFEITDSACPIFGPLDESLCLDFPTNDLPFMSRHDRLAELMREAGARVVLNGMGGDQLFWSTPHVLLPLLDALARRDVPDVLWRARECSRITGAHLLLPLYLGLRWWLLQRGRTVWRKRDAPADDWLNPDFVRETGLLYRASALHDDAGFPLPSGAHQYTLVRRTMRDFALDRVVTRGHIEVRYPYLDQRLIEFALALPFDQSVRWPETRSIVRRSLGPFIPKRIAERKTKAGPTEAMIRALIHQWPRIMAESPELRVAAYGIVDAKRFMEAIKLARLGKVSNPSQLSSTLSLELWLRSIESRSAAGHPPGQRQSVRQVQEAISRKEKVYEYH